MALGEGADLLIHDAQHTATSPAFYLGHSAVECTLGPGVTAGVSEVTLFHHDPGLDAIVERLDSDRQ
jgi:ribonuclease BN (tRNA processing enzyme)